MDDVDTAPRDQRAPRPKPQPGAELAPLRSVHLRRRVLALLALVAGLALIVGLISGSGSGSARGHPATSGGAGHLARIHGLTGTARESVSTAENAAIDRTLKVTQFVRVAGRQHREVALTFDDGPGPFTPKILSILEHRHVPATFFEVGVLERYFHQSTAAIVAHGYPIGDHTEDHAPMSRLSASEQAGQLLEQTAAVGDFGAPFPRLFRPPYGMWDATTLRLLKRYRMLMVLWTVDTGDYLMPGVETIVERALKGARPGAIILLHDAGGNRSETVAALPKIIRGLRRRGFKLVTVPRLLLDNPAPPHQNVATLAGYGG
jgi:peptidoglycan-N-acetylglucosamine deacetylase